MSDVALSEVIRNYAIVVGGVVGLGLALWRGIAHSRQAQAQEKQAKIAQRAHITEVFKDAFGHLGSDKLEIRLGAVLTLKQIAEDFPEFYGPVAQLLTAYAREKAKDFEEDEKPTVEIIEIVKFVQRGRAED